MYKIKRLKDLALNEYFVKIDDHFVNITKELIKNNSEKLTEIYELQQKIDKAIEYIKKYESIKAYYEYTDEDGYDEYNYNEDFKEELLKILGDKE